MRHRMVLTLSLDFSFGQFFMCLKQCRFILFDVTRSELGDQLIQLLIYKILQLKVNKYVFSVTLMIGLMVLSSNSFYHVGDIFIKCCFNACACVCVCVCVCVCGRLRTLAYVCSLFMYVCVSVHVSVCVYVFYVCICVCVCVFVCERESVCECL